MSKGKAGLAGLDKAGSSSSDKFTSAPLVALVCEAVEEAVGSV